MKKERKKGFVLGVICAVLALSLVSTVAATQLVTDIPVTYRDIRINIDGWDIVPMDANNNVIEPFLYNGSVYLPARAIALAFNKDVDWDSDTNTVKITTPTTPTPMATPYVTPEPQAPSEVTLSDGFYTVGEDIAEGKYNLKAVSGTGNLIIYSSAGNLLVNELFGVGDDFYITTFNNVRLSDGAEIEISGGLTVKFIKVD